MSKSFLGIFLLTIGVSRQHRGPQFGDRGLEIGTIKTNRKRRSRDSRPFLAGFWAQVGVGVRVRGYVGSAPAPLSHAFKVLPSTSIVEIHAPDPRKA